jgi:hypothetical protein
LQTSEIESASREIGMNFCCILFSVFIGIPMDDRE